MRYVWVGLTIVLLDLLGKLLAAHGVYADGLVIPLGFMQLQLFGGGEISLLSEPLELNLGTGLVLLVPLVAVLLLLLLDRPLLMSYTLFGLGVQFLAGSGLAEALTRFLQGGSASFVVYDAGGALTVLLSTRHMAAFAGIGLLIADQIARQTAHRVPLPRLQLAPQVAINLTGLRRGDDNVHIEASLSRSFMRNARSAISQSVKHSLAATGNVHQDPLAVKAMQALRDSYAGMLHVAMNQGRSTGDSSHIALLRLAVMVFVRDEIRSAIADGIERRYERSRATRHRIDDGYETQSAAEGLRIGSGALFHQVCRQVFLGFAAQEQKIQSSAGDTPPGFVQPALFSVPLLQAATPEDDEVLMEYYALLGHRRSDAYSFRQLDALFNEVFPASLGQPLDTTAETAAASWAGMAPSVLDVPQNITLLLDARATKEALREARAQREIDMLPRLRAQLRFQRLQLASLRLALEHAGLVTTLLALYEAPQLYSHYSRAFAPQLLVELMRSRQSRKRISRRMGLGGGRVSGESPLQPVVAASRRVRSRSRRDLSLMLLRFAEDFSAYRRDLRLYLATQEAVSKIKLLHDEREIITARMNHRLYEFPTPDEVTGSAEAIAGHVILKADLRGSTLITEQLIRRELNPATFFSRNFFEPISAMISSYSGEKIFIEGDAIILMFIETADTRRERLAVANACGLAVRLIEMLVDNNKRNASYELPALEIGIGITYEPGPPTYVFDGTTRIVISPAINRADRLSSSAPGLRKHIAPHRHAPRVRVFQAQDSGDELAGKRTAQLIYNVDGIALESAAFSQLVEELPLHRILDTPEGLGSGELFAATWSPAAGKQRRLVIRRARIHALSDVSADKPDASQDVYFEVISAPTLLELLEQSALGEPLTASSEPKSASLP